MAGRTNGQRHNGKRQSGGGADGEASSVDSDERHPLADASADDAIPQLVDEHGGKLLALTRRMCGNEADAEDLLQETFLQALRKWDQFEGRSKPETWLYTIAARLCMRKRRKRSGEPDRIASLESDTSFAATRPVPDLPGRQEDPLWRQMRKEQREPLEHAIVELPAGYRMPLILKDIIGFSVAEVAAILGLKEATVKTRVHRARQQIRTKLSATLPSRDAPPPAYPKRVCLDLLRAKQEALDRGEDFPMTDEAFCERCKAVFTSMDLAADICARLGDEALPEHLRTLVLADIAAEG